MSLPLNDYTALRQALSVQVLEFIKLLKSPRGKQGSLLQNLKKLLMDGEFKNKESLKMWLPSPLNQLQQFANSQKMRPQWAQDLADCKRLIAHSNQEQVFFEDSLIQESQDEPVLTEVQRQVVNCLYQNNLAKANFAISRVNDYIHKCDNFSNPKTKQFMGWFNRVKHIIQQVEQGKLSSTNAAHQVQGKSFQFSPSKPIIFSRSSQQQFQTPLQRLQTRNSSHRPIFRTQYIEGSHQQRKSSKPRKSIFQKQKPLESSRPQVSALNQNISYKPMQNRQQQFQYKLDFHPPPHIYTEQTPRIKIKADPVIQKRFIQSQAYSQEESQAQLKITGKPPLPIPLRQFKKVQPVFKSQVFDEAKPSQNNSPQRSDRLTNFNIKTQRTPVSSSNKFQKPILSRVLAEQENVMGEIKQAFFEVKVRSSSSKKLSDLKNKARPDMVRQEVNCIDKGLFPNFIIADPQALWRLKRSCMKQKSCIFRNQYLQVGAKSRRITGKQLLIQLHFNPTQDLQLCDFQISDNATIKLLQIQKKPNDVIKKGKRQVLVLLFQLLQLNVQLVLFNFKYRSDQISFNQTLALPILLIKFLQPKKLSNKEFFLTRSKRIQRDLNIDQEILLNMLQGFTKKGVRVYEGRWGNQQQSIRLRVKFDDNYCIIDGQWQGDLGQSAYKQYVQLFRLSNYK